MSYVIATKHDWIPGIADRVARRVNEECFLIDKKQDLSFENLRRLQPCFVFFPHWSWNIPEDVYDSFECVLFHMTDLPFGRGGSPLQNLVSRGIYDTRISAIRCIAEVDAGPIYLKRPLSLNGNAEEIYMRASSIIEEMIVEIVKERPQPQPQRGRTVRFQRRLPHESAIGELTELRRIYDFIRMLDASSYPAAFLESEHLRMEFTRASLKADCIKADVTIRLKQ